MSHRCQRRPISTNFATRPNGIVIGGGAALIIKTLFT
jgi:hypothetical protein